MAFGPSDMEQFRMFQKWLRDQGNRKMEVGKVEKQGVVLDEKYFRRVDKFDGDLDKYRSWVFEVVVALAQVDGDLSKMVEKLVMGREDIVGKVPVGQWDAAKTVGDDMHRKYTSELF